jgi:hypothetical protein
MCYRPTLRCRWFGPYQYFECPAAPCTFEGGQGLVEGIDGVNQGFHVNQALLQKAQGSRERAASRANDPDLVDYEL